MFQNISTSTVFISLKLLLINFNFLGNTVAAIRLHFILNTFIFTNLNIISWYRESHIKLDYLQALTLNFTLFILYTFIFSNLNIISLYRASNHIGLSPSFNVNYTSYFLIFTNLNIISLYRASHIILNYLQALTLNYTSYLTLLYLPI